MPAIPRSTSPWRAMPTTLWTIYCPCKWLKPWSDFSPIELQNISCRQSLQPSGYGSAEREEAGTSALGHRAEQSEVPSGDGSVPQCHRYSAGRRTWTYRSALGRHLWSRGVRSHPGKWCEFWPIISFDYFLCSALLLYLLMHFICIGLIYIKPLINLIHPPSSFRKTHSSVQKFNLS